MPVLKIGQMVTSKAGRDGGRTFVVLEAGDGYVVVADGDMRKVENPKKKNVKHVVLHDYVATEIQTKIAAGERVTNADIRRAIEAWESTRA